MSPHNAVQAALGFVAPALAQAGCVLDATAGNGHDTLFLCQSTPPGCRVFAIDIQPAAIRSATELIKKNGYGEKVRWICDDHASILDHIEGNIDVAVFNLGYLPGHDHALTTSPESLAPALKGVLAVLADGGRIAIVAYPGHVPGQVEIAFLEDFLAKLPQERFVATRLSFINQRNWPAILYTITKPGRNSCENTSASPRQRSRGTACDQDPG